MKAHLINEICEISRKYITKQMEDAALDKDIEDISKLMKHYAELLETINMMEILDNSGKPLYREQLLKKLLRNARSGD